MDKEAWGILALKKQIAAAHELIKLPFLKKAQFGSWRNTTLNYIREAFGSDHPNVENFMNAGAISTINQLWGPQEWSAKYKQKLLDLIEYIHGYIDQLDMAIRFRVLDEVIAPSATKPASDKVFIVHGHNHAIRDRLAFSLQSAGVDVTILDRETQQGRTLIEKFIAHGEDAGFAVVLLTADDVGAKKSEPSALRDRARQNVIFEFGFFVGLLRRKRVCMVYEPSVELPTDILGIGPIDYDAKGHWINQVAKEIHAAGIKVEFEKL